MLNITLKKIRFFSCVVLSLYILQYLVIKEFLFDSTYKRELSGVSWIAIQKNQLRIIHNTQLRQHEDFSIPDTNQRCIVPKLDPFHPDVLPHLSDYWVKEKPSCGLKRHGRVSGGHLTLEINNVTDAGLYYIQRENDFKVQLSDRLSLMQPEKVQDNKEGCLVLINSRLIVRVLPMQSTNDTMMLIPQVTLRDKVKCDAMKKFIFSKGNFIHSRTQSCAVRGRGNMLQFLPASKHKCNDDSAQFRIVDGRTLVHASSGLCVGPACTQKTCEDGLLVLQNCQKLKKKFALIEDKEGKDLSISIPLKGDFAVFEYLKNNEFFQEFYAVPLLNSTNETDILKHEGDTIESSKKIDKKDQLNVILLMIDSTSHANARRFLNDTYNYLQVDVDSIILNGHTIVGDGTVAQVSTMLAGEGEKDLPEARRSMDNADFVDRWPLIFKDFHRKSYKTLFSEDLHKINTFNMRLKGFDKQPAVKYLRPFWMAAEKHIKREDFMCNFEYGMQYLKDFFDAYTDYNKFGFISFNIIHDNMNKLPVIDKHLMNFYEFLSIRKYAMNTVVFLFGDHGARAGAFRKTIHGKLEERLPLMAISLPKSFRQQYPKEFSNLKKNSKILTSHYDIHATLKHLIDFPNGSQHKAKYGKSLFTDISPSRRTCAEAGVADPWCPCLQYEEVNITDKTVLDIAYKAVEHLNNVNSVLEVSRDKCSILTLDKIIRAGRRVPNVQVQHFESTFLDDVEVNKPRYNSNLTLSNFIYELVLSVQPSNGEYEITSDVTVRNTTIEIKIYEDISRLNMYSDQPRCIQNDLPHLRKYCFCKDYMNST